MFVALSPRVAVPAAAPADAGPTVSLESQRDVEWVSPALASTWLTMIERACAAAGFEPIVVGRSADFRLALDLCSGGLGACIVPAMVLQQDGWVVPPGVQVVRTDPLIRRAIYLATRQGAGGNAAVDAAVTALRASASRFAPSGVGSRDVRP